MKPKIVAVCGSMRFSQEMLETAERLELEHGWAALAPVSHVLDRELTEAEKALLGQLHRTKIDLADAVYVVNPGGYIGQAVREEIGYAEKNGKEILYLVDP
jgi:predicted phosphodiesterase